MAFSYGPMEAIRFAPVGRCIYCEAPGTLSDEHIVPYGIGGRVVLPEASCAQCATVTSAFELRLLRSGNWWPLRRALDLASRRARKQPDAFRGTVRASGESFEVDIKVASHPLVVLVLDFDPPCHLTGAPIPAGGATHAIAQRVSAWHVRAFQFHGDFDAVFDRANLRMPRAELTLQVDMSANDLARLLAKIALGWAIGRYGLSAFDEIFLRDLIIGDTVEPNRWVGATPLDVRFDGRSLHVVSDSVVDNEVIVHVQLFRPPAGWEQPPTYQVVVGRLGDQMGRDAMEQSTHAPATDGPVKGPAA